MVAKIKKNNPLFYYVSLWKAISRKRKLQLSLVSVLMLISSFTEIVSIGAIVPFLGSLMAPEKIYNSNLLQMVPFIKHFIRPDNIALLMTIAFSCAVLVSGLVRLSLLILQTRIVHRIGADISYKIFLTVLSQPFENHYTQNSSKVISAIVLKSNGVVYQTILPILTMLNYSLLIISILTLLIVIQPLAAIIAILGFGGIYLITLVVSKKHLLKKSNIVSYNQTKMIKSLQEGIGGIRYVIIDSKQNFFSNLFKEADIKMRGSQADIEIIGGAPRSIIETVGILLIVLVVFNLFEKTNDVTDFVSIVALIAFAGQRLLPAFQQCYAGLTSLIGGRMMLVDAMEMLNITNSPAIKNPSSKKIDFDHSITLKNINFAYKNCSEPVLKDINLSIKKGMRVGIVGKTGSGKSTLMDIMMGLLEPSSGELIIDGQSIKAKNYDQWQNIISHVPQSIFISDMSIAENIAFGLELCDIDLDKVRWAAQTAQISNYIESLDDGYLTLIGESGGLLSGGQAQRIGIARSLYKDAKVIFFDEATNALDGATEQSVSQAINQLKPDITTISISHHVSAIANCDAVYEVKNGKVTLI